jgi:hypothetical protein
MIMNTLRPIILEVGEEITIGPHVVFRRPPSVSVNEEFCVGHGRTKQEIVEHANFSVVNPPPNLRITEGKREITDGIKCELTICAEYPGDSEFQLMIKIGEEVVLRRKYMFNVPPVPLS